MDRCGGAFGSLVLRFGTLGWLLTSWLTMMRLLSPSSRSSTWASRQSRSSPTCHLQNKCVSVCSTLHRQGLPRGRQAQGHHHRSVRVLHLGRCQFASHDRCRCRFLAKRNFVVHVAGLRRHPTPPIVPTTLRLGIWRDQVAKYETQWDPPRPLQSKRLRGAEIVLARLLHESLVPRLLTPVSVKNYLTILHSLLATKRL